MCDAAGSDAEYAGMAVHRRQKRLPQRRISLPVFYERVNR